ncbi:Serum paraoxonase/arylesterase 2 [Mycena kentingensis (nom. inval.)]|nr:Serum paraoxonase/arylesterase 2 [Mycena kentingensis (nom. inval.)]
MSRVAAFSVLLALLAAVYQLYVSPVLVKLGRGRVIQPTDNSNCKKVPELAACEKIVVHESTGLLFLACSSPASRALWVPATMQLNASGPNIDYLATYDPSNGAITRFSLPMTLQTHGMDVVPSETDPGAAYLYAVNHRKPANIDDAPTVGADSTIEVFLVPRVAPGESTITHLRTVRHPLVFTPNDVVGSADGRSVFFTNDYASKTSSLRRLAPFGFSPGSIGFCSFPSNDAETDCKLVASSVPGVNGITRARTPGNDTFFVSQAPLNLVSVFERQQDNALLKVHEIPTPGGVDNLSVDSEGVVWGAGIPSILALLAHIRNPTLASPSSALAITKNVGAGSFYGEKFTVHKVFEDDGTVTPGTTTVAHDAKRGLLFIHGICSPQLTVCKMDK